MYFNFSFIFDLCVSVVRVFLLMLVLCLSQQNFIALDLHNYVITKVPTVSSEPKIPRKLLAPGGLSSNAG